MGEVSKKICGHFVAHWLAPEVVMMRILLADVAKMFGKPWKTNSRHTLGNLTQQRKMGIQRSFIYIYMCIYIYMYIYIYVYIYIYHIYIFICIIYIYTHMYHINIYIHIFMYHIYIYVYISLKVELVVFYSYAKLPDLFHQAPTFRTSIGPGTPWELIRVDIVWWAQAIDFREWQPMLWRKYRIINHI